jgi:hypothetical protein
MNRYYHLILKGNIVNSVVLTADEISFLKKKKMIDIKASGSDSAVLFTSSSGAVFWVSDVVALIPTDY